MASHKTPLIAALLASAIVSQGCGGKQGGGDPKFPLAGTTWIAEKKYWNGAEEKVARDDKVIFRDDVNQVNFPDYMGSYHMDSNANPKTMGITIISQHSAGGSVQCIWERDGDQLKLAFSRPNGNVTPKDFTPRKGDETNILIMKRAN